MNDPRILASQCYAYNPQIHQNIVALRRTILDKALLAQIADIAVFVSVVEHGRFSGAANRLGLAKSAVSRRIDRLERNLGQRLLQRSTRSLSMTEAGRTLYAQATQSIALLDAARHQLANLADIPSGVLKITTSVAFGRLCIAPLLAEFLRAYPQIQVQLLLLDRMVDLVEEGIDLAIRLTPKPPELLVAKALMPIDYVLCAAPRYLKTELKTALKSSPLARPADLAHLNCLAYGGQYSGQNLQHRWLFQQGIQKQPVQVTGNVAVNSSEVLRDLLLDGVGVGLIARYAVARELAKGKLQQVLADWQPVVAPQTSYALWLPQPHLPPKIRVFVDFLKTRLDTSE